MRYLTVGPIIGSQLFEHATHGWTAIMCLTTGLIVLAAGMRVLWALGVTRWRGGCGGFAEAEVQGAATYIRRQKSKRIVKIRRRFR
jgi:hypothetical protein